MNKTALLLVLFFLSASFTIAAEPVSGAPASESKGFWTQKASMHVARSGLGVAVVDGKIYAIGGSNGIGYNASISGIVGTNEVYDPATDTWSFKASMPTPRTRFAIAAFQNKIYCIGGTTGYSSDTGYALAEVNEVYDPATDTWETKASMPTARSWLQANVVGCKIYLIGGDPNGTLNEVYDPATNSWTTKASMPTGAIGYASAVVDNEIYVFWATLNQIYDPATDNWSQGASLPYDYGGTGGAGSTTGALAPKRIYVIGVPAYSNWPSLPCYTQVYDPENRGWTVGANITARRYNFGVVVLSDTLYAIGGVTYDFLWFGTQSAVNEQYTPIGYGTITIALVIAASVTVIAVGAAVLLVYVLKRKS